jgi:hypothetical protein
LEASAQVKSILVVPFITPLKSVGGFGIDWLAIVFSIGGFPVLIQELIKKINSANKTIFFILLLLKLPF